MRDIGLKEDLPMFLVAVAGVKGLDVLLGMKDAVGYVQAAGDLF